MIDWQEYVSGWRSKYGVLYIVCAPGYPLRICEWITGSAFVDIATGRSVNTETIAFVGEINIPDQVMTDQIKRWTTYRTTGHWN